MFKILLILIVSFGINSLAQDSFIPAKRKNNRSYVDYVKKLYTLEKFKNIELSFFAPPTEVATHYKDLDISSIPQWNENYERALLAFQKTRDSKYFIPEFTFPKRRRLSWLYPHDGCFMRAEYMKDKLEVWNFPTKKIFIFGNLKVKTPFSSTGSVSWWYHVVPTFRIGKDVFVLDPALDAYKPLPLEEWVLKQVPNLEDAKLAVCHSDTYVPSNDCLNPEEVQNTKLKDHRKRYLNYEWSNVVRLGLDPMEELGNSPYWERR